MRGVDTRIAARASAAFWHVAAQRPYTRRAGQALTPDRLAVVRFA